MKTRLHLLSAGMLLATLGTGLGQQPAITNQPQSQTACMGSTATFLVGATGTEPLSYQWQYSSDNNIYVDRPDATNNLLVITNVQTTDTGYYRAVVTNSEGAVTSAVASLSVALPPRITMQPTNFAVVSLGASVANRVYAYSTVPMTFQWRLNGTELAGQTKNTFSLTNLQVTDEGDYDVVVASLCGSVTSSVVPLKVDPTFTKITSGAIVTDSEGSITGNWADIDNDGFPELFVANSALSGTTRNTLYKNSGGTNFSRVNVAPFSTDYMRAWNAAWADYDNDGNVDLIVANIDGGTGAQRLYRNNGNGTFTAIVDPALRSDTAGAVCPWWFDYDADGFVDLFMAKGTYFGSAANDCLFRNNGDGTFRKMTAAEVGPIVNDQSKADACWSADFNNDGRQELTIVHRVPELPITEGFRALTWSADANGIFSQVQLNLPSNGPWPYWADYNNDGWLDAYTYLLLNNNMATTPGLFRNSGTGEFMDTSSQLNMITPVMAMLGCWGDYDNDGWLDLFYTGNYYADNAVLNGFYRNNGDGSFTQILTASPVYDGVRCYAPSWIDYNNDGFLDLFIAAGDALPERNLLYRNNGNSNHWLKVKLEGRASNRSGIGAKVRAQATLNGRTFWQVREVQCANAYASHSGLIAHFGLGDAASVTTLKIEWPSGIVQELQNVAANQFLTVVESQGYTNAPPQFTEATNGVGGMQLTFSEPAERARYILEASTNLVTWTKLMARTSTGAVAAQFTDSRSTNYTKRFYRLLVP